MMECNVDKYINHEESIIHKERGLNITVRILNEIVIESCTAKTLVVYEYPFLLID
jgi:hypothetical protein